jgi:succinate dehydrogenase/fumarate reductase flavoprotein subunit
MTAPHTSLVRNQLRKTLEGSPMKRRFAEVMSRRSFVTGSLLAGGTVAGSAILSGCSQSQHWDKETDVVVAGYGGAGAVAAITASEGGASVIILEKASQPGGNTACASGNVRFSSNQAKIEQFLIATGLGSIDQQMAKTYIETWMQIEDWMSRHGAQVTVVNAFAKWKGAFPNAETPDRILTMTRQDQRVGSGKDLFEFFAGIVQKHSNIEVMLGTPAHQLVQDPATGEILGVVALKGEQRLRIRAKKGVIMALGGFEANRAMMATYIQESPVPIVPAGTPYNTGDGIRMALDAGADLWHMNAIEWGLFGFKPPELPAAFWLQPVGSSWIVANKQGARFLDESTPYSHVKKPLEVFHFDEKKAVWPNHPWYMVFDEKIRKAGPVIMIHRNPNSAPYSTYNLSHGLYSWSSDNSLEIEKGWIKKGNTIPELAQSAGIAAAGLQQTVATYNNACRKGKDEEFGRNSSQLVALDQPPYYGLECVVTTINTQGGPRRNARSQVMSPYGGVIPKLYAAGEFGSIWGFLYPGGTNLSECIVSGILAGRSAVGGADA